MVPITYPKINIMPPDVYRVIFYAKVKRQIGKQLG
ncbi:hypothetical protein N185_17160 [Sinorhizobium sp. GW3]|nr:hypothetical protein N185_17160 [Sinorhizobium sp. GW3]